MDNPLLVLLVSFALLWSSALAGFYFFRTRRSLEEAACGDFSVVLGATLTLLGMLIGFRFSKAVGRYDQRKNVEEVEANAIGTEFFRAGPLPAAGTKKVRALIRDYLDERILFYTVRDEQRLGQIKARTAQLQGELWGAAEAVAAAQQTTIVALAVSGMGDVLNSQGYTPAAWWNRIPNAAWALLPMVALFADFLIGYGARNARGEAMLISALPVLLSIAFFLIADIESPRGGIIATHPKNLEALAESLHAH